MPYKERYDHCISEVIVDTTGKSELKIDNRSNLRRLEKEYSFKIHSIEFIKLFDNHEAQRIFDLFCSFRIMVGNKPYYYSPIVGHPVMFEKPIEVQRNQHFNVIFSFGEVDYYTLDQLSREDLEKKKDQWKKLLDTFNEIDCYKFIRFVLHGMLIRELA